MGELRSSDNLFGHVPRHSLDCCDKKFARRIAVVACVPKQIFLKAEYFHRTLQNSEPEAGSEGFRQPSLSSGGQAGDVLIETLAEGRSGRPQ